MKIVLLWAYSVWKTTISKHLQETFNLPLLPDIARLYAERHNIKFNEIKNPYDILNNQIGIAKLYKEIKESFTEWYIEDGSGILGIVYTNLFCSPIKETKEFKEWLDLIKSLNILPEDEIKILLPISFPIKEDWLRHTDPIFQKKVENELLAYLNHNNINYYFVNELEKEKRKQIISEYILNLNKNGK